MTTSHGADLGARLRRIRHQQGLSLADVQERSDGEWKAVVVGAYERGDRGITVTRLSRLAAFYGVPMADLLPGPDDEDEDAAVRITLDLTRLDVDQPDLDAVRRFADHVQHQRGDHNGRLLTLRGGDLDTIALAVGSTPDGLRTTLADAEVLLEIDLRGEPRPAGGGRAPTGARLDADPAAGVGGPGTRTEGASWTASTPAQPPPRQLRTANRHASRSTNPAAS